MPQHRKKIKSIASKRTRKCELEKNTQELSGSLLTFVKGNENVGFGNRF
jgi:hypothetical protein